MQRIINTVPFFAYKYLNRFILIPVIVFAFLFSCGANFSGKEKPLAKAGILELGGWNFEKDGPVQFRGEWEFYWNQLLQPADFDAETSPAKTGFFKVPQAWNKYKPAGKKLPAMGYATYRLQVHLDPGQEQLAVHVPSMYSAYRLYINGTLLSYNGRVAKNRTEMIPQRLPRVEYFQKSGETLEILLQISNFHHRTGGPRDPIRFGNKTQITRTREHSIALELFVVGSLVILGLYHLGIFFIRRKDRAPLFFALFCLLISIRSLIRGEMFIGNILFGVPWEVFLKSEYISYYMAVPFFASFLDGVFPRVFNKRVMQAIWLTAFVFTLLVLFTSARVYSQTLPIYSVLTLMVVCYFLYIILFALIRRMKGAGLFFLGSIVLSLAIINDVLSHESYIQTGEAFHFGLFFFIFIQAYLLSTSSSRAFAAVEELTDELAQANDKLQSMDRAKTRFFANLSHEFRTPLTLIQAPVESIRKGDYGESVSRNNHVFKSILQNSGRLLRLINNLLDFTKIEAGRMTPKKRKTDMVELLEYFQSSVQSAAEIEGLEIVFKKYTGGLVVYIDRDLMEKAIINLLGNAIKFTPPGGRIVIQLEKNEDSFALSVTDTGIGVPEDKLETIFERFSQVDESISRKHEGTGIGLSLTREIVELHGGTITVQSSPGKGSVFTIKLPLGEPEEDAGDVIVEDAETINELKSYLLADLGGNSHHEDETPDYENRRHEHRILLVEDNVSMRSFLKTLLEQKYAVGYAQDGKEGLAQARERLPDLILSDVMMPEMDGYEMTRKLKSGPDTRDIPVILLSAKADVTHRVEGLGFGADDYLSKPFNAEELMARIRNQIQSKKLESELKKEKKERDYDFGQASLVQKSILTPRDSIRQIDELEIDFIYRPMNGQVSGDYYNIAKMDKGIASIFLADATGHGTQAALSTMQIDMLYRENLRKEFPNQRFEHMNQKFISELHSRNYFTGIILDISSNRICYSSAGHPEQYYISSANKEIQKLRTSGGIVGLLEKQTYGMEELETAKGDMLLLFSDGIYEVFNGEGKEFGEQHFFELVQAGVRGDWDELPMAQVIDSILGSLDKFRDGVPFADDITLIGMRFK